MFNFVNIVCQSWGEIHFVIGPPYIRKTSRAHEIVEKKKRHAK